MPQTTAPQLTVPEIGTIYNADDGLWTVWTVGNSKVWGTGKSEQEAIKDMWVYQGLMEADVQLHVEVREAMA